MQLTYRYRLYPSRAQEHKLFAALDSCRWLYNHFLEKLNQKEDGKIPRRYELQATLPELKRKHPGLKQVHSKVLQMVLHQLYSNLRALAELKRNGRKVGRLRFKSKGWFKSFTYNQSGFKIIEGHGKRRELWLSKIGPIPIVLHREPIDGKVKQVHIKRERSGKWFACFSVEVEETPKVEKFSKPVGIDLGIAHYTADTAGNFVEHPHNISKSEWRLKREQHRLSRKERGSKNRAKQRVKLARAHERVRNQRLDFLHKLSRYYVSRYDFIAVEDLGVKELIEMAHNGKNRADAAWATFLHMLTYKAERAGGWVEKVEPRETTDRCSKCGEMVEKPLCVRVHRCPRCGLELDRDLNAAQNILQDGLKKVGWGPAEFAPVEIGPLSPWRQARSSKQEAPSG